MVQKTANLYARIEPNIKEQAEQILSALGVSSSNAINMFYKQIILHRGIPFSLTLPEKMPLNLNNLTKEQLSAELEQGYADIEAGKIMPVETVFAKLRQDYPQ
ncbi:MAG: type II toxin-antitoxin system RelB/DinJ family antitoxin [Neisseriaceae bacterium]|nr:type II toxin-antitoxin system RelB/DinJ family antitoxin [Neisseriaceae bacterium]